MSLYAQFKTDPKLEAETGVLLDYGTAGKILIHRAGGANKKFSAVLQAKLKPHRRQIDAKTLEDETATRLMAEAFAEAVIVDWEGVKDEAGNDLPFTKANVVKLLVDLPEFFKNLQDQAGDAANFRAEQIAKDTETLKNA